MLFTIMTNNLLADWHLRVTFVDDMSAMNTTQELYQSAQFDRITTNVTLKCQAAKRLFVIIVKSITPSFVP